MAVQNDPYILSLILQAAGPRDHVEYSLARRLRRDTASGTCDRRIYFADDGNERAIRGHQGYHCLWFDRPVLDAGHDLLLHFRRRLTGGGH